VTTAPDIEDLLRELAPQVLGVLVRRFGDFDAAEDAVQEALLSAAVHWPREGTPDNPRGWLIQTGSRRLLDQIRSERGQAAPGSRGRAAGAADRWIDRGSSPRRHVDRTVHVLPSGAHRRVGYRADVAGHRRLDHRRDR
jgi:predicted RNA polymerase sigma factor